MLEAIAAKYSRTLPVRKYETSKPEASIMSVAAKYFKLGLIIKPIVCLFWGIRASLPTNMSINAYTVYNAMKIITVLVNLDIFTNDPFIPPLNQPLL